MFDFNNLSIISKFTIPSEYTTTKEKGKNTEPTECTYNQGLGPDAINPFTCKVNIVVL